MYTHATLKIMTRMLILIAALIFTGCSDDNSGSTNSGDASSSSSSSGGDASSGGGDASSSGGDTSGGDASSSGGDTSGGDTSDVTLGCVDPDPSATCLDGMDCADGLECAPADCVPSSCECDPTTGAWGCTRDCLTGASTCQQPIGAGCASDAECTPGQQWCEDGQCEACDNSGQLCRISCPEGWGLHTRNECSPCECAPINECASDVDCRMGQECIPGDICLNYCGIDDPSCCYGNACQDPVAGSSTCDSDAECTSGQEWCTDGVCEPCDNTGAICDLACVNGFTFAPTRNGCSPCECIPEQGACLSDTDCGLNETCVAGDLCYLWCSANDPSCCYNNTCE